MNFYAQIYYIQAVIDLYLVTHCDLVQRYIYIERETEKLYF